MKTLLMSPPNIYALYKERKWVTRRMKGLEEINSNPDIWEIEDIMADPPDLNEEGYFVLFSKKNTHLQAHLWAKQPIEAGDEFYVREPWKLMARNPVEFSDDGSMAFPVQYITGKKEHKIWFTPSRVENLNVLDTAGKKQSIFMPKEVARFKYKVRTVLISRLSDMTKEDIMDEGIVVTDLGKAWIDYPNWELPGKRRYFDTPNDAWFHLWNGINGDTYPAMRDPWVWAIKFRKL